MFLYKINFFFLIELILSSCSNEIKETNAIEIPQKSFLERSCCPRPDFFFERLTEAEDSVFKKFIAPMDSIDELIESENLKFCTTKGFSSDAKKHWKSNGHPIKIMTSGFVENNYTSEYYIIDNCYWMHKRKTFHWNYPDSITKIELRSYRDTTLLNALMTNVGYYNYFYCNIKDNKYTQNSARKSCERFKIELQFIR